jgi:hypothetical protein
MIPVYFRPYMELVARKPSLFRRLALKFRLTSHQKFIY